MKNSHLTFLPFFDRLLNMYSMVDIIASLPQEKNKEISLVDRFLFRPLSFPVTWAALRMGISAAAVSYFSGLISIAGGIFFAWPSYSFASIGILLFFVFSVLDSVDGNIARVKGKACSLVGWSDAVMVFITYCSFFFASGLYLFWKSSWWPVLLISGLTSSANLLTRLAYQIYKNIEGESAHSSVSFERKLAENTGITGFLVPLAIIFHFCNYLPGMWFIIWFNAAFYSGGCGITVIKLARKAAIGAA
jgi:phosphatidylglycerophosphate synthase